MPRNGDTAGDDVRAIAVPREIEAVFRAYAHEHPEYAARIERVLRFRRRVGEEFERLIEERQESVQVTDTSAHNGPIGRRGFEPHITEFPCFRIRLFLLPSPRKVHFW